MPPSMPASLDMVSSLIERHSQSLMEELRTVVQMLRSSWAMPDSLSMLNSLHRSAGPRAGPLAIVCAIVVALAAAGCGDSPADAAKLHLQAQAALSRWADAVAAAGGPSTVVLVGERTGQVGDWEANVGDNDKSALYAGMVAADPALSSVTPPQGKVRWEDGTTAIVSVLAAQQALLAIQTDTSSPCGDCRALHVKSATLTTAPIQTSRGAATGPVWELTIDGTSVKVTRVAIADAITVVPPTWDANNPPVGLSIDSASGTVGGRTLTVTFVGAPSPGDQPCGEDYTGDAVESDLAVVVIVTRHPHATLGEACSLVGAARTATVMLTAPLGQRAVLEVQQGLPVPVVLTP